MESVSTILSKIVGHKLRSRVSLSFQYFISGINKDLFIVLAYARSQSAGLS